MRSIITAITACLLASGPAFAAVEYDELGRVRTYSGSMERPLTWQDAAWVGGTVVAVVVTSFGNPTVATWLGAASFLVGGALRTAHYRPASVKAQIRAGLERRRTQPIPGTVESF